MESRRHIAWPSIDNLGSAYAIKLQRRIDLVNAAATAIQRWWRWTRSTPPSLRSSSPLSWIGDGIFLPRSKKPTLPRYIRYNLLSNQRMVEKVPVVANEKLDGTNLGKGVAGTLYGRRTVLPVNSTSYLKSNLSKIDDVDTVAIKAVIVDLLKPQTPSEPIVEIENVVLFGEFILGHDKFGYRKREKDTKISPGDWFCFGAKIVLLDSTEEGEEEAAEEQETIKDEDTDDISKPSQEDITIEQIRTRLHRHGFSVTAGLTISLNSRFRSLLSSFNIPTVPFVTDGPSLYELVLREDNPVLSLLLSPLSCEGVVLTGFQGQFAYKWKTSAEDCSASGILLSKVKDAILDTRLVELTMAFTPRDIRVIEVLQKVINTPVPASAKKGTPPQAKAPVVNSPEGVALTQEIQKAYDSALTKYDSLETYFTQPNAMKTVPLMLAKEVIPDIYDYQSALSGLPVVDLPGEVKTYLTKAVEAFVNKTVGRTFGEWKRTSVKN